MFHPSPRKNFSRRETQGSGGKKVMEISAKGRGENCCYQPSDGELAPTNCLHSLGSGHSCIPRSLLSCSQRKCGINPSSGMPFSFLWAHFCLHYLITFVISSFSQANFNPLLFTFDCFVFNVAYKDFMCFCFINVILLLLWQSASIFFRSGNCIFIVSCSQRDKLPCISHRH